VRTAEATVRPLWRRIEATGYVGLDETRISHINLRTQGWVVRLAVNAEGERVSKGDLLFELYSPQLVNAQKEFVQAHGRGDQRLVSGAEEKLRALGMIPEEIGALAHTHAVSENVKVVAPQDGIVSELNVRDGMFVQPNTTVISLADLSSVWLLAEVFESQSEWVAQGQAAEASFDFLPGSVFSGEVDYVYPVLDPKTRTLRVRLRFDNPGERLKPNMYARVSIFGRLRPQALTVPREALIRGPERDRVVVDLGDGHFRVHEVLAGMESGGWVEILAGIEPGDRVVTSAQFLLDSEASLAGSIQRLDPQEPQHVEDQAVTAFGNGWVDAIDLGARTIRITHGPIDELAWPGMTMDFKVDATVDLGALQVGKDVQFQLRQEASGIFVIAAARQQEATPNSTGKTREEPSAATGKRPQAADDRIPGAGTVVSVDNEAHALRLKHQPIEALGWPAMTMNFAVATDVDLAGLEAGQNVRFLLRAEGKRYVIVQVQVADAGDPQGGHGHD